MLSIGLLVLMSVGSVLTENWFVTRRIVQEFASRLITRVLSAEEMALRGHLDAAIHQADFVANAAGDFTSSSQRFAYDTTNGQLFYSATGSNSSESLVASLAGAPDITAGNLLFEH